jgi:hypothetical protein
VYAEFLGSFALIPSLIFQHSKDENFLKFPYRFSASHPGVIHLPDDTLYSWSFIAVLPYAIHVIGGGPHHYGETGGPFMRWDPEKEKAVTLVML